MKSIILRLGIAASLLSSFAFNLSLVAAKKDAPEIKPTTFDSGLDSIFYFDDSDVILGLERDTGIVYRSDDAGETWHKINDDGQAGASWDVWPHPWDNQRAYILGDREKNWISTDQGKTWTSFTVPSIPSFFGAEPFKFHARDPKRIIWNGADVAYYTDDDFKTHHLLATSAKGCQWAVGTPMFNEDNASKVDNRIFCITEGLYSDWRKDYRLLMSDDYFKREEIEPALDNGRAVTGIISMASVKKYIVAAAKSEGTDELALYVTDDGTKWHRAEFGQHRIAEDAYTILESTNYSMQVDVLGSKPMVEMGHLFTSNSNGTYFTKNIDYTNRNIYGRVDFEKIQNIQGIVLVNVVDNHEEVEKSVLADKLVVSQISFDDGRTFEELKTDGGRLHLHSVTDAVQGGRMFSSPAPGIVMGVGNTGKFLKPYEEGDLYVSDDAGRTWIKALTGAHMYEFGNNGAVLVAADDQAPTDHIRYSLDHGQTWEKADLDEKVKVRYLTTAPDSTTLKFLMMGLSGSGSKMKSIMFKIDFEGLHERTCSDKDFEKWAARTDDDGKATCLMGHKQYFRRRKADSKCFINDEFKDPEPEFEPCACTKADFECDFNFERSEDRKECIPVAAITAPEDQCKDPKDKFTGPSGWRLIPGNDCERKNGENLDKDVERPCSDTTKKPPSGEIAIEATPFKAKQFSEWYYLDRANSDKKATDETIIMRTSEREIYISKDHGKKWAPILKDESITNIIPNPYNHHVVYFLTGGKKVWYTIDRGNNFDSFTAPKMPSHDSGVILKSHPEYKDWLLWSGWETEHRGEHTNVYYSKNRGYNWDPIRFANKCEFIHRKDKDQLIYCKQYEDEDPEKNLQLVSSDDFFASKEVHFDNILDFATMAEFIIVAAKADDQKGLKVDASVDGRTFAPAQFPKNFQVDHQQAYTVLDSSTHAVFLHVTVNPFKDQEYGTIIKSNSNGTSYVLTLDAVNRDEQGFVDFEKMQGLEGVAMVNVVANARDADNGAIKKLKSMITHNDGAEWALIPPPKRDALQKDYDCVKSENKATKDCSLHLHSYTERVDKSATFSSPSAIGLMMAVGNVGEFLESKDSENTDTFITRDAGITWNSVKKGSYMWEYGDQGSVIVIVPEAVATRTLFYTLDEGQNWKEFEFSKVDMEIDAITTLPSDNSLNFLLWGRETSVRGTVMTINIDFSGLKERSRLCDLDEEHPVNEDYDLWSPKHPMQDNDCLFGHQAQYHRKKTDADCYNGKRFDHLHTVTQNCTCTRQDFECSYNFQIQTDGTCQLVEGLQALDPQKYCDDNPDAIEYFPETGYRRIPITTCTGGNEYDKTSEPHACKGKEPEYERKHGISGAGLFFAITMPIIAAIAVGYWVWKRYQEYGLGGFGQIRLGDSFGASTSTSNGQSPFISIPVAIIAGVWAVVKAVPLLASSLFRSAKGYVPVGAGSNGYSAAGPYRSRDAFSRRQDYSNAAFVEDDELLGDEEEAEGEEV